MSKDIRESMIYGYMLAPDYSYIQEFSLSDIVLGIKKAIYNIIVKIENALKKAKDSSIKEALLKFIGKFKKLFEDCNSAKNINDVNRISEKTKEAKKELDDTIEKFTPKTDDIINKDALKKSFNSVDDDLDRLQQKKEDVLNSISQRHSAARDEISKSIQNIYNDNSKDYLKSENEDKFKEMDDALDKLLEESAVFN